MRLTRKKAIELCIELWTWLAKTGKEKRQWPKWEKYNHAYNDCWFCEYDLRHIKNRDVRSTERCKYCPLEGKGKYRCETKYEYGFWSDDDDIEGSKKYASLFLKQIKTLKK